VDPQASKAALSLLPYAKLGWLSAVDVALTLTCGAVVVAHLAEVVDNQGLGDGLGLYILCEILKGLLMPSSPPPPPPLSPSFQHHYEAGAGLYILADTFPPPPLT